MKTKPGNHWRTVLFVSCLAVALGGNVGIAVPSFVLNTNVLFVPEDGTAQLRLWLSEAPDADVTGTVAFVSGDTDLSVSAGSPFTISQASWNSPVVITLAAAEDADTSSDAAVFVIEESSAHGIAPLEFTARELDNDGLIAVGGTLTEDTVWDDTTADYNITSTVVVPEGISLTIGPDVLVRQQGSAYVAINVQGELEAEDSEFVLFSTSFWDDSRRSGIHVQDGGVATLERCALYVRETNATYANDVDPERLAAALQGFAGGEITARGCVFHSLRTHDQMLRTGYGIRAVNATVTLTDSTPVGDPPIRNRFVGFRNGLRVIGDDINANIALCDFVSVDRNVLLGGTLSRNLALRNMGQFLLTPLMIDNGGLLNVVDGAELRVRGQALTVGAAGNLEIGQATLVINRDIVVHGFLNAQDALFDISTRAFWSDAGKTNGFHVTNGGMAFFTRCQFQATESDPNYGNDSDISRWASAVLVDAQGAPGDLTLIGCSFVSTNSVSNMRTGYGVFANGGGLTVSDAPGGIRNSFTGFRTGIRQIFGSAVQNVAMCDFDDCLHNMRLRGTLGASITLRNVGMLFDADVTVPANRTMILTPGSELNKLGGPRFIVNGLLQANDSTFNLGTRASWRLDPERNHGLWLRNGGNAEMNGCRINAQEIDATYASHSIRDYWAASIYVDAGSKLTARGCDFVSLNQGGLRTDIGVKLVGGDATITDAEQGGARTSFTGFTAGVEIGFGDVTPTVAICNFTDVTYPGLLLGELTRPVSLRNVGQYLSGEVTVKAGGHLNFRPGSRFLSGGFRLNVEDGGALTFESANATMNRPISIAGTLTANHAFFSIRTNAGWNDSSRWSGIIAQAGSSSTLNGCTFLVEETRQTGSDTDYAAAIQVLDGAALEADGCAFTSLTSGGQPRVRYMIQSFTAGTLHLTNNYFTNNHFAVMLETAAGDLLLRHNDFDGNVWSVYNRTNFLVSAIENWWGSPSGPTHNQNPGGTGDPVSDNVDYGQNLLDPSRNYIQALDPPSGQQVNSLVTSGTHVDTELLGVHIPHQGTPISGVGFLLRDRTGMTWNQLSNFRLAVDTNADGEIGPGETQTVGGVAVLTAVGDNLLVSFRQPFITPSAAPGNYILIADAVNLQAGASFEVAFEGSAFLAGAGRATSVDVSPARHAVGDWIVLANPAGGQVPDGLNSLPVQADIPLFGFRMESAGAQVREIVFALGGVSGLSASNFGNVRLLRDGAPVGGAGVVSISGANGTITFADDFDAQGSFLLLALLSSLTEGNQFTVSLPAANVDPTPGVSVTGSASPATHLVDWPFVLSQSNNWAPPQFFGEGVTQPNFPLLGLRISPLGRAVESLRLDLSSVVGIRAQDIANAKLYWDVDGNGHVDATDSLLANGAVVLDGSHGTIDFTGPFDLRGDMIVTADFTALATGNEFTVTTHPKNVGIPDGYSITGSMPAIRYVVDQGMPDRRGKNQAWTLTYRSPGGLSVNGRYNNAGDKVILGYDTGSAWIFDAFSNTPLLMLKDHYDHVRYAGFSSDDSAAITVSRDGAVNIWDIESGIRRAQMFSDLLVTTAVPSPDFLKLMVITEGKGILLDIDNQRRLWEFIPGNATVESIAYSPNGEYILIGSSDRRAYLLDVTNGVEIRRFLGHSQSVTAVGFTGDGSQLMTGSTDATVQLWPTLAGSPLRTITLDGQSAQGAAVNLDGTRIAMVTGTGNNAQLRMYNETGLEMFAINLRDETGDIWGGVLDTLSFDNAGERVIVCSRNASWARVSSFRVNNGRFIRSWGPRGRVATNHYARPRISEDGEHVLFQGDWGLNQIPRQLGNTINISQAIPGDRGFAASEDGSKVAWFHANGALSVDSVSNSGFSQYLRRDVGVNYHTISMSAAGDRVAGGDRMYSAMTGALRANYAVPDAEFFSAFSPDGSLWGFTQTSAQTRSVIVMRTEDRNATLYRLVLAQPFTPHELIFAPDNRHIFVRDSSLGVQRFDMDATPEPLPVGLYRFPSNTAAALSKDGTMLLIGGRNTVRLFEVRTGRVLRYFYPQHSSLQNVDVRSIQFAMNDSLIMVAWSYNYVETYERTQAVALEMQPRTRRLAQGQSQRFQVEVVYDDSTRFDVSPGRTGDDAVLEIDPPSAATVDGNVVTVSESAQGTFVVRALYRENGLSFVAESVITVGQSDLVELSASPANLALNPGVFRQLRYIARYDDGYETEVTSGVQLSTDEPESVTIAGQSVMVNLIAPPGNVVVNGVYEDEFGNLVTATTTLTIYGQKTVWQRARITGGGYGESGDFSPNGQWLAAGYSSGAVNLYQVGVTPSQYALHRIIPAHDGVLLFTKFINNDRMVTASSDGTMKTWTLNPFNPTPDHIYRHTAPITCAAFRDNRVAFGDTMGNVGIFNIVNSATDWVVPVHAGQVTSIAIDGDTVLSGGEDWRAKLLERADGTERRSHLTHTGDVVGVGYLSATAYFTLSSDETATLWNKATGEVAQRYEFPAPPTSGEVIGGQLYVTTKQPVATWVYNADGLLLRWLEHLPAKGSVSKVLLEPGGNYLLTGRQSTKIMSENAFGFSQEEISSFSSFQFWESGRGIFRGSLAHSFDLIGAHASDDGLTIFTQDEKRTMQWNFDVAAATTEGRQLMETGYFINPRFTGMVFTGDNGILATRVGVSIFMFDTQEQLLWKTLHTPGVGPFAISPDGSRMATADSMTRLWDLANLSQISQESRRTNALAFRGSEKFLGAVPGDKFVGVWNRDGLLESGMITQYDPVNITVSSLGDRVAVITQRVESDGISTTIFYYLEIFDISDVPNTEGIPVMQPLFLLQVEQDIFGGGEGAASFAIAVSDDTTMALVGASGDRPVKLISTNDGSTLREFYPPGGGGDLNIGSASVRFAMNDTGVLIGWREGYAELHERSNPVDLTLQALAQGEKTRIRIASSGRARVEMQSNTTVNPGQVLRGETFAIYENGEELNVTSTATLSTDDPHLVFIEGTQISVNPAAPLGSQARINAEYQELDQQLFASLTLDIGQVATPTPVPAGRWDIYLGVPDGRIDSLDLFQFSREWQRPEGDRESLELLDFIREMAEDRVERTK